MLHDLKKKLKQAITDNTGSAIVVVIIALAMVGILAMTIMWMSMTNYYMKATDKGNKQGFYTSETVLEQIKAGIEEDASLAASRAYAYILTKDYQADATADRNYEFKKQFINYFVEIVRTPASQYKYDLSHLQAYVDSAIQPSLTKQTTGTIRYLSTTPDKGASFTDGEGDMIYGYDQDIIQLRGLHLEFTDRDANNNEYVSIIDTDVFVSVPDVSFTQTATLPDVFEYALVANKKLHLKMNGKTEVKGSIYAGEDGMTISDELKVSDAGRLISKGDVKIGGLDGDTELSSPSSKLTITGKTTGSATEFWANDIQLGNHVTFETTNVNTYVADDLTLSGRKASVKMTGTGSYTGYGNSDSVAANSSAIVVNGLGSTVDMDGISNVNLLGRTFISVPHKTLDSYSGTISVNSIDFAMGESIAVKGEQVAFLVPDYCLTYSITQYPGTVSENTVSMKLSNPFGTDGSFDPSNLKVNLTDFSAYVPPNGYKVIYPNGPGGLAYVYMQMAGDKANEYYEAFYKNNKEKLDNYFLVYTNSSGSAAKVEVPGGNGTKSEGNFITALGGYTSTDPDKIIVNNGSQLNLANASANKDELHSDCEIKKQNLCAKLIPQGATVPELSQELFLNLIRKSEVEDLISRNGGSDKRVEFVSSGGNKAVFVKPSSGSEYEYSDTSIRVLVVLGDVKINANFTGLLIAEGTITSDGDHKVTSIINASSDDIQALKDCLQVKKNINYMDAGVLKTEERNALRYFVDGSGYDLDGLQSSSSTVSANRVDFTELVKFNNWVKK